MRHSIVKTLAGQARAFAADRRGNFAMMFGLTGIVLMTATGMAVDAARLFTAQARLNMAVDAAVLSTTRDITNGKYTDDEARQRVRDFVFANIDQRDFFGSEVTIDRIAIDKGAKTLAVQAWVDLPMTLSRIVGIDERRVSTGAKAQFSNTRIEVAMALDVTGSMQWNIAGTGVRRIDALKSAARLGVEELLKANAAVERVRIGLVPYARSVDASPVIDAIETDGPSNGCVFERTGPRAHTDDFATFARPVGGITKAGDCPTAPILPLTADKTTLDDHIDGFAPRGWTAGHIAIAWTQYMLSSLWNPAWPAGSDVAADSDEETRKVAIIMTDGEFNTYDSSRFWPDSAQAIALSRANALGNCANMKDRGIAVYTIAFTAPSADGETPPAAVQMMRDCATPEGTQVTGSCTAPNAEDRRYFFNATSEDELEDAFRSIARDITCLRLVS
ncbi:MULTISPECIES: TadE/TadG family type IV pilus assembly protein [unclassified Roseitalea]|uniref:pilus assembly protein TadG-related protein n=1 Tax=unclassified Roseitalea TaxID=2639107 RepID=UPI00273D59A3|nr:MULTISPECIES: TadE/TadG family type IV pilus assembly protein [unclassified Roseitalea]